MIKEFSDAIKYRIGSPLLGTYSLSLLMFNWEILTYLFSSENPSDKIQSIHKIMCGQFFLPSFAFAALTTIIVCFAMPYISNWYVVWLAKIASDRDIKLSKQSKISETAQKIGKEKITSVTKLPSLLDQTINIIVSQ